MSGSSALAAANALMFKRAKLAGIRPLGKNAAPATAAARVSV